MKALVCVCALQASSLPGTGYLVPGLLAQPGLGKRRVEEELAEDVRALA